MFLALGTVNTISLTNFDDASVLKNAAVRVKELHRRLSVFRDDSDISAVNMAAGKKFVKVHPDTLLLLKEAKRFANLTEGAFDPTIRPLVKTWNVGNHKQDVPSSIEIKSALSLINDKDLLIDEKKSQIKLRQQHMAIDLGAIAKGYAADEVRRFLLENGVKNAVINLGGTVSVIGGPKIVGIQNPKEKTGIAMGHLQLENKTAVTSGSYEKFFQKGGIRYHHILDPKTGYPANSGLSSVTLIGENALTLDALSTAVFVMGAEEGCRIAKRLHLQAIFVTNNHQVLITEGLTDIFHLSQSEQPEAMI